MASESASGRREGIHRVPSPQRIEIPNEQRQQVVFSDGRESEGSIKARKDLLFDDEDAPLLAAEEALIATRSKPFGEYLRSTPATPLSGGTRAMLYTAGVVVLALLGAALLRSGG
jgi:hypothetical protein